MKNQFEGVFEAHPDADKIFVVNDQPFLDEREAENYARGVKAKVEPLSRPKGKRGADAASGDAKDAKPGDAKDAKSGDAKDAK